MTLIAVSLSLALALTSMLAWDFGRRWIEEQAARRTHDARVDNMVEMVQLHDQVLNKLPVDFKRAVDNLSARIDNELQRQARTEPSAPTAARFHR